MKEYYVIKTNWAQPLDQHYLTSSCDYDKARSKAKRFCTFSEAAKSFVAMGLKNSRIVRVKVKTKPKAPRPTVEELVQLDNTRKPIIGGAGMLVVNGRDITALLTPWHVEALREALRPFFPEKKNA